MLASCSLQSFITHIVYSGATTDVVDPLLYSGFVEELVEVLEMKQPNLHVRTKPLYYNAPSMLSVLSSGGEGQLFACTNCHDSFGEGPQVGRYH